MRVDRRYRRYWILTGTLSLIIFHPFPFDISLTDSGGNPSPQAPSDLHARAVPHPEATQRPSPSSGGAAQRNKKILEILSGFETGLEKKQEEKLASFIHQE